MAQLTDGKNRYIIVSAIDFSAAGFSGFENCNVLDISGASTANQAKLIAHTPTGGNNQLFRQQIADATYVYLRSCNGGKALEIYKAQAKDRVQPTQFTPNGSAAQKWYLEATGETFTLNGTAYPCYYLHSLGSTTGRVLTCYEDDYKTEVNPIGYPRGSAADYFTPPLENQQWVFIQSSLLFTGFPVPTAGGGALTNSGTAQTVLQANSGSLYPSVANPPTEARYQCRYRTRKRAATAAQAEFEDWSDWKSYDNDSTANLGWGDSASTATNISTSVIGKRHVAASGLTLETLGTTYDRCDYEFQWRRFEPNYNNEPRHGGTLDFTVSQVSPVAVNSITATWSPDGLIVGYDTTWTRGGSTCVLESEDGLFTKATVTPSLGVDDALIPNSRLLRRVNVGDTVRLKVTFTTADGASVTSSQTVTVTYGGTVGTSLTLTASVSGTLATITASIASAKAWLIVPRGNGDRFIPLAGSSPWTIAPPLGVPWKVYATGNQSSVWNATLETFNAITEYPPAYHVTSQDLARDMAIALGGNEPPAHSQAYSRDVSTQTVEGRERPVNAYGMTTEGSLPLSGVLLAGDQQAEFEYFAHASHVYLRTPNGGWHQVGVKSARLDKSSARLQAVSFDFVEESW